jgi:solute carrier family 25 2-oxodicarboxylate transporter 21
MGNDKPPLRQPLPFHFQFIAGAIAGICEVSLMYPLDVVKTRLQQQTSSNSAAAYRGVIDCFRRISREEGMSRLYRGLLSPLMVEAPKRAMKFATQKEFKRLAETAFSSTPGEKAQLVSVVSGVLTGITEAWIVSSFELVKIRMQDRSNVNLYRNTGDCARKIWRTEGPLAFLRGIEAACWRNGSWNGAYFGCIQSLRSALPVAEGSDTMWARSEVLRNFVAGTIGGMIATTVNTPFDVVKTRIQSHVPSSGTSSVYRWAWPGLVHIVRSEGVRGLYRGFLPKVLRLGPGGGVLLVVFDAVSNALQRFV